MSECNLILPLVCNLRFENPLQSQTLMKWRKFPKIDGQIVNTVTEWTLQQPFGKSKGMQLRRRQPIGTIKELKTKRPL